MTHLTLFVLLILFAIVIYITIVAVAHKKSGEVEDVEEIADVIPVQEPHVRHSYPHNLDEFVGQKNVIENLKLTISVCNLETINGEPNEHKVMPHTVFYGGAGLGKTTLAELVAQELKTGFFEVEAMAIDSVQKLVTLMRQLNEGDVLFIDEIHRFPTVISEVFYRVMENYTIEYIDPIEGLLQVDVPKFTCIGATTDFGMLLKPLRDRFIHRYELSPYSIEEIKVIAEILKDFADDETSLAVAKVSQNTPRILKSYLRTMWECSVIDGRNSLEYSDYEELLKLKELNEFGLTKAQVRVLQYLNSSKNAKGIHTTVGVDPLSVGAGVAKTDLEDMHEPFLITQGYLQRTPRGRLITNKGVCVLIKLNKFEEIS